MNPKKVYLTDTGFAALGRPFAENRGRLLENLVAIELFRRDMELYYFKNRHECDFIVKHGFGLPMPFRSAGSLRNATRGVRLPD
jgi:predicted AAA+ superfamily ATPase